MCTPDGRSRAYRADEALALRVVGQAGGVGILGRNPVLGGDGLQALLVAQVPHLDRLVRAQADELRTEVQGEAGSSSPTSQVVEEVRILT